MNRTRSDCKKIRRNVMYNRQHWTKKRGQWKRKKIFKDREEAMSFIAHHKELEGYRPYICECCGQWHIGKTHP